MSGFTHGFGMLSLILFINSQLLYWAPLKLSLIIIWAFGY